MEYKTLKIIKEEPYRSKPYVNITDDSVRITLTCSRNEWRRIKKELLKEE